MYNDQDMDRCIIKYMRIEGVPEQLTECFLIECFIRNYVSAKQQA